MSTETTYPKPLTQVAQDRLVEAQLYVGLVVSFPSWGRTFANTESGRNVREFSGFKGTIVRPLWSHGRLALEVAVHPIVRFKDSPGWTGAFSRIQSVNSRTWPAIERALKRAQRDARRAQADKRSRKARKVSKAQQRPTSSPQADEGTP
jgi:hypothetical protein